MPYTTRTASAVATLLISATALVACTTSPSTTQSTTTVTADPLAELATFPAYDTGSLREQEKFTESCMKEAGFEYTPMSVSDPTEEEDEEAIFTTPPPETEWVKEHGFGIVESYLAEKTGQKPDDDPNTRYVATLSPSEQAAYDTALYGDQAESKDPSSLDWTERGCVGAAEHASETAHETVPPILIEASEYRSTLLGDPKFTPLFDDWQSCMAEAGYPDEPIFGRGGATDQKISDYFEQHSAASATDSEVVSLKKQEVALALADHACQEKVDLSQRVVNTLADLEKGFIEKHKSEIEEARLWVKQTYPDWSE